MKWPPSDERWNQILKDLPADSRAAARAAVDAAVRAYLTDRSDDRSAPAQSELWHALARQAAGKAMKSFCANIEKLRAHPLDPEAQWLLYLASELGKVVSKAKARAVVYQPRDRKARLYVSLFRAWTDARGGDDLGESEEGPLPRFLCAIAEDVPFKLSESGAKKAIGREKVRRHALTVLGEKWAGQSNLLIDETKVYLVDQFGNRKP